MSEQVPFRFDVPSVTQLTSNIKQLLESNFTDILVEGELSNVNQSRNGHYYFTVKDRDAQLPCVMWKGVADRLGAALSDGRQVVLGGDIQVYAPHGRYQMIVSLVEQAGMGKLQQAFEELKKRLKDEGLFDEAHKKRLPAFPSRIGVITSSSGAAFRDISSTLEQRWPLAHVILYHASVQGVQAAPELVAGLHYMEQLGNLDLLIIGRGGGSLEDLWPFNEEAVARAIFNCNIPVISAVGHEVDYSISDFTADARASTPTRAAVMAVPHIDEVRLAVEDLGSTLSSGLSRKIERYREKVRRLGSAHALLVVENRLRNQAERLLNLGRNLTWRFERLASTQRERIEGCQQQLQKESDRILSHRKEKLAALQHRLDKCDPNGPLERGYVRVWQKNRWVRNAGKLQKNQDFELQWNDGRVRAETPE